MKPPPNEPSITVNCSVCHEDFMTSNLQRKFCSRKCRLEGVRIKYHSENPVKCLLPKGTIGAIKELVVATDLLSRGYEVFRSLSPSTSCDIAILKDRMLLRIEVTSGFMTAGGKLAFNKHDSAKFDVIAVVMPCNKEIVYLPDLAKFSQL